jgi:hypothetical protein
MTASIPLEAFLPQQNSGAFTDLSFINRIVGQLGPFGHFGGASKTDFHCST